MTVPLRRRRPTACSRRRRRREGALGAERLVVLVNERPGHRVVHASVEDRLALAAAAFPNDDVRLDPYPRTVELLRAERFDDPVFVVGADQFRAFLAWSEPAEVLELTRLAVATRPGFPRSELEAVLGQLDRPERVLFLDVEPNPAASADVRARIAAGEQLDGLVPPPWRGSSRSASFTVREPGYTAESKAIQGHSRL